MTTVVITVIGMFVAGLATTRIIAVSLSIGALSYPVSSLRQEVVPLVVETATRALLLYPDTIGTLWNRMQDEPGVFEIVVMGFVALVTGVPYLFGLYIGATNWPELEAL